MQIAKFITIFIFISISITALAQETVIIPFEEVVSGEPLNLKYTLVSETGKPILGAKIKAKTDFFGVELFDDGKHNDNTANDGIYGNVVDTTNAAVGTYVITYNIIVGKTTKPSSSSFKILPKPFVTSEQAVFILVAIGVTLAAAYYIVASHKKAGAVNQKIKDLESKKKNLKEVMKNLEHDYFKRIVSEDMFKQRVQENREKIMEIDSELKGLKRKP